MGKPTYQLLNRIVRHVEYENRGEIDRQCQEALMQAWTHGTGYFQVKWDGLED